MLVAPTNILVRVGSCGFVKFPTNLFQADRGWLKHTALKNLESANCNAFRAKKTAKLKSNHYKNTLK